jgi:hypothetical protein
MRLIVAMALLAASVAMAEKEPTVQRFVPINPSPLEPVHFAMDTETGKLCKWWSAPEIRARTTKDKQAKNVPHSMQGAVSVLTLSDIASLPVCSTLIKPPE